MWETVDPDGRRVVLTFAGGRHVVARHPELARARDAILTVVTEPAQRHVAALDEEWFYGEGVGPSRWIRVVVHYEGAEGSITTAFPRRSFP